jgi:hypothetical protein
MSEMSSHDSHPESRRDYDLVFNAETVRALHREARVWVGIAAIFGMWVVALAAIFVGGPVSLVPPSMQTVVGVLITLSVVPAVIWWVMGREGFRAIQRETVWIIRQKVGLEHKLPPESEYRPFTDTDDDESPAYPALVLGRATHEWAFIVGLPLAVMLRIVVDSAFFLPLSVGLGGCVALGAVMFWLTPMLNTYPPGDAP